MQEAIEIRKYKNKEIRVYHDEDKEDPRTWDSLGKMICFHKSYNLGDKTDLSYKSFNNWEELEEHIRKHENGILLIPLRLYDHSGISMSTSNSHPYNCRWDSGQVGFIFTTKEKIKEYLGVKKVTKKSEKKAIEILENEVKTYDKFLTGEIYRFVVIEKSTCKECKHTHEEVINSCGGFFTIDDMKDYIEDFEKYSCEDT